MTPADESPEPSAREGPPADVSPGDRPAPAGPTDEAPAHEMARRRLVAAAGLLLLAAVGLMVTSALVGLNEDAGGATVTETVVLEGRPARTAAPRIRRLDPFADVVFLRVSRAGDVALLADPGGGPIIDELDAGALVASDDDHVELDGLDWVHVHDAATGSWGWIPAGSATAA